MFLQRGFAVLFTALVAAFVLNPATPPDWLYDIAGLLCAAAIAVGLRAHGRAGRAVWMLYGASVLLSVCGNLTYELLSEPGVEPPFPSLAEIPYLLSYPVSIVALSRAARLRGDRGWAATVDGVLVALAVAVPVWAYWIGPSIRGASVGDLSTLASVAYPVMDLTVLAVLCRLALGVGHRTVSGALMGVALLLLFGSDVTYNVQVLAGTYASGEPLDLGWILMYGLVGLAALHPSAVRTLEPGEHRSSVRGTTRAGVLAMAALVPLTVIAVEFVRGRQLDLLLPIVAFVALTIIVAVRILLGVRSDSTAWRGAGMLLTAPLVLVSMGVGLVELQVRAQARHAVERALLKAESEFERFGSAEKSATAVGDERSLRDLSAARKRLSRTITALDRGALASIGLEGLDDELQIYLPRLEDELRLRQAGQSGVADRIAVTRVAPAREALGAQLRTRTRQYEASASSADRLGRLGSVLLSVAGLGFIVALLAKFARARGATTLAEAGAKATEDAAARVHALLQGSADIIIVVGPDTTILAQAATAERVLGHAEGTLEGTRLDRVLEPERRTAAAELLAGLADGPGRASAEWRLQRADGSWMDAEVLAADHTGDPRIGGFVLNVRDVTARKRLEARLQHQALHDHLTGLANRALLEDRVRHALGRSVRTTQLTAILFVDLDDFKLVNDTLGHATGDQLLIAVGERIAPLLRPVDTLARIGGDEFAVLLEELDDPEQAIRTARRLLDALRIPAELAGRSHVIRASVGIAVADGVGEATTLEERAQVLLRNADLAMYEAKRQGDGAFEVFVPRMHEAVSVRMLLKSELQRALDQEELVLHYQPIVELAGGEVVGFEALVRWQHPTRGLVPPGDFIAAAEQTGQIVELGAWVLGRACAQLSEWRRTWPGPPPYVAVNVSGRQLQRSTFVEEVAATLAKTGLPPQALLLEVTETALIQDTDGNERRMRALHDLGVRLAIDDFGTGYSSLNYLRRFPMDVLKIDKSFVDEVAHHGRDAALIDAMIHMGTSLDLCVVAEGIEDDDQREALAALDCGLGQGYLFARPLPAGDVPAFLAKQGGASARRPAGPAARAG